MAFGTCLVVVIWDGRSGLHLILTEFEMSQWDSACNE